MEQFIFYKNMGLYKDSTQALHKPHYYDPNGRIRTEQRPLGALWPLHPSSDR